MDFYRIGQKISEARIKNNKTQEELSENVGITPAFLSNIETNKRKPSLKTLLKIAKELNLSLDYLILDDDVEEKMKNDICIRQIYKQIENFDDNKKNKFLDIIDFISKKI